MTEPRKELAVRITYTSRQQQEADVAIDVETLLEWSGAVFLDDVSDEELALFIEQHDPESMIGWGALDELTIDEVNRLV